MRSPCTANKTSRAEHHLPRCQCRLRICARHRRSAARRPRTSHVHAGTVLYSLWHKATPRERPKPVFDAVRILCRRERQPNVQPTVPRHASRVRHQQNTEKPSTSYVQRHIYTSCTGSKQFTQEARHCRRLSRLPYIGNHSRAHATTHHEPRRPLPLQGRYALLRQVSIPRLGPLQPWPGSNHW